MFVSVCVICIFVFHGVAVVCEVVFMFASLLINELFANHFECCPIRQDDRRIL